MDEGKKVVLLDAALAERTDTEIVEALVAAPEGTEISLSELAKAMLGSKDERYKYRWAMICSMVAHLIQSGERLASFLLEVVNPLRRIPGFHFQSVLDLLDEACKAIDGVADDARRARLEGLAFYHRGQLYETAGKFELAAKYHHEAVGRITGNDEKSVFARAVSTYMVAHMEMCVAIVADAVTDAHWARLKEATTDTLKNHPQWRLNAWHDLLQFKWYCGGMPWSEFVQEARMFCGALEKADASVKNGTLDAGNFLSAYVLFADKQYRKAFDAARAAADRPGGETGACLDSLMLCAKIDCCLGNIGAARALYGEIANRCVLGGHVQRAVAVRCLQAVNEYVMTGE